jgi:hypothetical protein
MNATHSKRRTFKSRNSRSTFPICAMNVWWLIQMMPIVTKLTT